MPFVMCVTSPPWKEIGMNRLWQASSLLVLVVSLCASRARAEDVYYDVRAADLKFTEGQWPAENEHAHWPWMLRQRLMAARAVLNEGEAHLLPSGQDFRVHRPDELRFLARAPAGKDLAGKLFIPLNTGSVRILPFTLSASSAKAAAKESFLEARQAYYESLMNQQIPGGAWFRREADLTAKALGRRRLPQQDQWARRNAFTADDTYDLFTGGRAVSENLALDRALILGETHQGKDVDIASIKGITVKGFDWKPLIKDAKPKLDPLAALVPEDQHAIFFPSFQAMSQLSDQADTLGTEALNFAEPRSEDARVKERYQKQLCLPMTAVGRIIGPQVIEAIAVTGSDPYLRVGSDVAVIFEAKDLDGMRNALSAQLLLARRGGGVRAVSGDIGGVAYNGVVNDDRSVCAYQAVLGNAVVVTNSLKQLERIAAVHQKKVPSLGSLDEYVFFRERYRRGEADEACLIVVSDATIRRWCSPQWRIADSRRTRVAAAMADLQAAHAGALALGTATPQPLESPLLPNEKLTLTKSGVHSATYGTLEFMTPIIELGITSATSAERVGYERWRDAYQNNWRNYFDPIALRVVNSKEKLALDLTVMPLIANSEYRELVDFTGKGKLLDRSSDPHDALVHLVLAVDRTSNSFKQLDGLATGALKSDVGSWVGESMSIYVDDDEAYFARLAAQMADGKGPKWEDSLVDLPVAIRIDSRDAVRLSQFLIAARGLTGEWTNQEAVQHNGRSYVRLTRNDKTRDMVKADVKVYYVALPDGWTISLNEKLIQRVIDRHVDPNPPANPRPWAGRHFAARGERRFLEIMEAVGAQHFQAQFQTLSWANIPILNEWKRLHPDRDPVEVHQRLWSTRLLCPAGGRYVWNAEHQTMESTATGHPGAPKSGKATLTSLQQFRAGDFGLDFENDGLRARATLHKAAK
jgi:hypothetical protein